MRVNEQDELDRRVDDVLRRLTAPGDQHALRARVVSRLEHDTPSLGSRTWEWAKTAAAVLVLSALASWLGTLRFAPRPVPDAGQPVASPSTATEGDPTSEPGAAGPVSESREGRTVRTEPEQVGSHASAPATARAAARHDADQRLARATVPPAGAHTPATDADPAAILVAPIELRPVAVTELNTRPEWALLTSPEPVALRPIVVDVLDPEHQRPPEH